MGRGTCHIDDRKIWAFVSCVAGYLPAIGALASIDIRHQYGRRRRTIEQVPGLSAIVQHHDVKAAFMERSEDHLCDQILVFDEHHGQFAVHYAQLPALHDPQLSSDKPMLWLGQNIARAYIMSATAFCLIL